MSEHSKILEDRNASLENEMEEMQAKLDWFQTENRGLRQMVTKAESDWQGALATCSIVESQGSRASKVKRNITWPFYKG